MNISGKRVAWFGAVRNRLLVLALFWGALVGPTTQSLLVGAVAVPIALVASLSLSPPNGAYVRLLPLARFVPRFLWTALVGSADVARRAFSPRMNLTPGYLEVPIELAPVPAQLFLSAVIGLVPGSLAVDIGDGTLTLHLLDATPSGLQRAAAEVHSLERRVHQIFGVRPPDEEPSV